MTLKDSNMFLFDENLEEYNSNCNSDSEYSSDDDDDFYLLTNEELDYLDENRPGKYIEYEDIYYKMFMNCSAPRPINLPLQKKTTLISKKEKICVEDNSTIKKKWIDNKNPLYFIDDKNYPELTLNKNIKIYYKIPSKLKDIVINLAKKYNKYAIIETY
jgi:hypothetical protein